MRISTFLIAGCGFAAVYLAALLPAESEREDGA